MKKRWWIIIAIIVVILLGLGVYIFLPSMFLKDCGNELSCMRAAFDKCSFAKYSIEHQVTQFSKIGASQPFQPRNLSYVEYAEIRGPWFGGCRIYIKWTDGTGVLGNWKYADMKCLMNIHNYDFGYDGLRQTCKGRLLDAYGPGMYDNPEYGFIGKMTPLN